MNHQYIQNQIDRYNNAQTQAQRDDCLYRIGTHADILEACEQAEIDNSDEMPAKYRCGILEALLFGMGAEIDEPPSMLVQIFGEKQLQEWHAEAKKRYPHFELCLGLRPSDDLDCFEMSLHFQPLPGAPAVDPETDFPYQSFWDAAELFFFSTADWDNDVELIFHCYPSEEDFAIPGSRMDSREIEPLTDEDLCNLSELLELQTA